MSQIDEQQSEGEGREDSFKFLEASSAYSRPNPPSNSNNRQSVK